MKETECVKYSHPDYSDEEVEGLMRYFRFDRYIDFLDFLKKYKNDGRPSLFLFLLRTNVVGMFGPPDCEFRKWAEIIELHEHKVKLTARKIVNAPFSYVTARSDKHSPQRRAHQKHRSRTVLRKRSHLG